MHSYQDVLLSWRLNADVLVTGVSGSYYVGRDFTSATSGYTAFTTLTRRRRRKSLATESPLLRPDALNLT